MKMKKNCIPIDITIELLSRLPARSLIRFRCVCKLWQSITHNPYFIDAHLNHARKSGLHSILLFFSGPSWDRKRITVIDENSRRTPKGSLWRPAAKNSYVGNSCNGLVCIYGQDGDERIQVINPVTGESLTLPENTETNIGCRSTFLGFHPETKEYKVICFFITIIPSETPKGCEIYTLGASNWRPICIPHHCLLPCRHPAPAIVKGTIYWLTGHWEDDQFIPSLLSFDLKRETFARISLPYSKICQGKTYGVCRDLVELQGSIFLTVTTPMHRASRPMDIWTLTANNDDANNTKFEWALKYSLLLPIGDKFRSTLLIHNEKILVHKSVWNGYESDNEDELVELIYCHLNSKGQGHKLYYHEEGALTPMMYDYLKGEYEEDKNGFYSREMFHFEPFVHINSLVSLQRN